MLYYVVIWWKMLADTREVAQRLHELLGGCTDEIHRYDAQESEGG